MRPGESALKVLYIQDTACSRTSKHAQALRGQGVHITLLELSGSSHLIDYTAFDEHIVLHHRRDLGSLLRHGRGIRRDIRRVAHEGEYQVVHTHNAPDLVGVWALQECGLPVVHDIHDLMSATTVPWASRWKATVVRALYRRWERQVCRRADAIVVPSQQFVPLVKGRYGTKRVFAIESRPAAVDFAPLPKRSALDGNLHVVYAGGMTFEPGSERLFFPLFDDLASESIRVHVYPATHTQAEHQRVIAMCEERPYVEYHPPVPSTDLPRELSQYDYGFLWYTRLNENTRNASPNKLWDYLLADLAVITNKDIAAGRYVEDNRYGIAVSDMAEARDRLLAHPTFASARKDLGPNIMPLLECYRALADTH